MYRSICILTIVLMTLASLPSKSQTVYLLPGQGGDERLFQNIRITGHETQVIVLETPMKGESLPEYAKRLSAQIDTTRPFSLVGVSFGGMIAVEMTKILNPQKVILISSAKTKAELPYRYKIVNRLRLYQLFNGKLLKSLANIARPIAEPDSRTDHELFSAMINDKDPAYLARAVQALIRWENMEYRHDIIHIHGTDDHTIPIKNIYNPIIVEGGSHVMILTMGETISTLINEHLACDE